MRPLTRLPEFEDKSVCLAADSFGVEHCFAVIILHVAKDIAPGLKYKSFGFEFGNDDFADRCGARSRPFRGAILPQRSGRRQQAYRPASALSFNSARNFAAIYFRPAIGRIIVVDIVVCEYQHDGIELCGRQFQFIIPLPAEFQRWPDGRRRID